MFYLQINCFSTFFVKSIEVVSNECYNSIHVLNSVWKWQFVTQAFQAYCTYIVYELVINAVFRFIDKRDIAFFIYFLYSLGTIVRGE